MCALAAGSPPRAPVTRADPRAEIVVPVDVVRANALAGRSTTSWFPVALTAVGATAPAGAVTETAAGETPLRSSLDVATIRVRPSKCAPDRTGAACAAAGAINNAASATRNPLIPRMLARRHPARHPASAGKTTVRFFGRRVSRTYVCDLPRHHDRGGACERLRRRLGFRRGRIGQGRR